MHSFAHVISNAMSSQREAELSMFVVALFKLCALPVCHKKQKTNGGIILLRPDLFFLYLLLIVASFLLLSIGMIDCCVPLLLVVFCCMSAANYNKSRQDNIIVGGGRRGYVNCFWVDAAGDPADHSDVTDESSSGQRVSLAKREADGNKKGWC